jgi:benzoyl-CoA reductase/2-hydroxyglutaryl-CoA dehydratase subunit BcrC/BadD/HgdB
VKKDNIRDLSARYQHLKRYIDEWKVDGVVIQSVRYCDPHGYEVVPVMDYMRHIQVPAIYVEHNYSEGAFAPLRTRIEAFVETLG